VRGISDVGEKKTKLEEAGDAELYEELKPLVQKLEHPVPCPDKRLSYVLPRLATMEAADAMYRTMGRGLTDKPYMILSATVSDSRLIEYCGLTRPQQPGTGKTRWGFEFVSSIQSLEKDLLKNANNEKKGIIGKLKSSYHVYIDMEQEAKKFTGLPPEAFLILVSKMAVFKAYINVTALDYIERKEVHELIRKNGNLEYLYHKKQWKTLAKCLSDETVLVSCVTAVDWKLSSGVQGWDLLPSCHRTLFVHFDNFNFDSMMLEGQLHSDMPQVELAADHNLSGIQALKFIESQTNREDHFVREAWSYISSILHYDHCAYICSTSPVSMHHCPSFVLQLIHSPLVPLQSGVQDDGNGEWKRSRWRTLLWLQSSTVPSIIRRD